MKRWVHAKSDKSVTAAKKVESFSAAAVLNKFKIKYPKAYEVLGK